MVKKKVESYRDILGDTRHRTVMSVGRMDDVVPKQVWAIADGLNARYRGEAFLFEEESLCIRRCSEPTEKVKRIYAALNMKEAPFVQKKSVVRKTEPLKNCKSDLQIDTG